MHRPNFEFTEPLRCEDDVYTQFDFECSKRSATRFECNFDQENLLKLF